MRALRVALSELAAGSVAIRVQVPAAEFDPAGSLELLRDPVEIAGVLSEAGGEYIFQGNLAGRYRHACDRCLDAAETPFSLDVCWVFVKGAPSESPNNFTDGEDDLEEWTEAEEAEDAAACYGIDGEEIDLGPVALEEMLLAAPAKFLCREECAGLCPVCGANWNHTRCECTQPEISMNRGFSGLAELFPSLKPKRSED